MTQKKTHKVYILLGEMAVKAFKKVGVKYVIDNIKELKGGVCSREFETEKEATAYCLGLDDAIHWEFCRTISENTYNEIVNRVLYEED